MKTFVKVVIVVALAALLMFEVGSPLWARSQLAGAAQDAASAGARDLFQSGGNPDHARVEADRAAAFRGVKVTAFTINADGTVTVKVSRQAKSYVLHRISALKNWYNVTASATAAPH
jgi:Flp pilus assembly protein TadG